MVTLAISQTNEYADRLSLEKARSAILAEAPLSVSQEAQGYNLDYAQIIVTGLDRFHCLVSCRAIHVESTSVCFLP